jgi:hypothetical protein
MDWKLDLLYTCRLHRLWLKFPQWRYRQSTQLQSVVYCYFTVTVHNLLEHALSSLGLLSLQYSGTGFQRRTFPFLVSLLSPRHSHSNTWLTVHSLQLGPLTNSPELRRVTDSLELSPITASTAVPASALTTNYIALELFLITDYSWSRSSYMH